MARSSAKKIRFGALARRYASAIFDLAVEAKRVNETLTELQGFNDALQGVPSLFKSLEDKEVPRESKLHIVTEISKIASLSPMLRNAIMLIVEKDRLELFDSITGSYQKMAEGFERLAHVEVTIANQALESTVKERIEKILSDTLKKKVVCETKIDSSLIGGVVVRVGDFEVNASISGRLAKMRDELI